MTGCRPTGAADPPRVRQILGSQWGHARRNIVACRIPYRNGFLTKAVARKHWSIPGALKARLHDALPSRVRFPEAGPCKLFSSSCPY